MTNPSDESHGEDDRTQLPIESVLPEVLDVLRAQSNVVLHAPTGAGKTTRVPPALLDAGLADDGAVLVVQPRRLPTRAAARRIAAERGTAVGADVGYVVRFDSRVRADSRLIVMTEGILIRMLQDDPYLERAAAVVFDEFHERNLNSDLALAMVRRIQETVRPELRIVVMSATLDTGPIAEYLGDCPVIASEGRRFPVNIQYLRKPDRRPMHVLAAEGVGRLLDRTDGDVLVFLPGIGEIRQMGRELEPLARQHDLSIMELYGDLPAADQDAVLLPGTRRKIVLSTNVAETSVTIEGITAVVDTGQARKLRFDANIALDRLELGPISQASADQRAGRAGRLQSGICLRLWDEASHRHRAEHELPEVRRLDLAGPILQLRCWGEHDVRQFPWFELPNEATIEQAEALLRRLDAVDDMGVTELGRTMSRLPAQPRIARLLIEGHRLGQPASVALAAALLSERGPFLRRPSKGGNRAFGSGQGQRGRRPTAAPSTAGQVRTESDVADRVRSLEEFEQTGKKQFQHGEVNVGAARFLLRARRQLLDSVNGELGAVEPPPGTFTYASATDHEEWTSAAPAAEPFASEQNPPSADEAVMRALLAAFPDRLARRRGPRDSRGLLGSGRGVRLSPQSGVTEPELFLCIDVDAGRADSLVRQASAVRRDWLPEDHLRMADELFFHPTQKRIVARRRTYFDDLLLDESNIAVPDDADASEVLFQAAAAHWNQVFPAADPALNSFLVRVRCLRNWMPELDLPRLDQDHLHELLRLFCQQAKSFEDLKKAPWLDSLRAQLTYQQQTTFDQAAPERLQVPSGSHLALEYRDDAPPILAVRIQELFGQTESPRIAAGRVTVLLHLLAPNNRPQQITDDLASFWSTTYPQVRRDLRGRYPKHAWPEDPTTATPESRPRKRRQ